MARSTGEAPSQSPMGKILPEGLLQPPACLEPAHGVAEGVDDPLPAVGVIVGHSGFPDTARTEAAEKRCRKSLAAGERSRLGLTAQSIVYELEPTFNALNSTPELFNI